MAELQSRIVWWSSEWALRSDLRRGALPGCQLPPTSHQYYTVHCLTVHSKSDYVLAVNSTCVDITKLFRYHRIPSLTALLNAAGSMSPMSKATYVNWKRSEILVVTCASSQHDLTFFHVQSINDHHRTPFVGSKASESHWPGPVQPAQASSTSPDAAERGTHLYLRTIGPNELVIKLEPGIHPRHLAAGS